MDIVNEKYKFVYTFGICAMLFLMFPLTIVAQTANIPDDNQPAAVEEALLSFSIDETPVHVGNTFTLHLNVENVTDLTGWQCNIEFDPNVLEAVEVVEGDFLKGGSGKTHFLESEIDNTAGKITKLGAARTSKGGVSGTGKLLSVAFVAKAIGEAQLTLANLKAGSSNISEAGVLEIIPLTLSIPEIVITVEEQPELNVNDPGFSFSTNVTFVSVEDTFTLHLNANDFTNLSRWQCDIMFDPNVLEAVEVLEGDFLKEGDETTFFLNSTIDNTAGKITGLGTARLNPDGVSGTGRLLSVVFTAKTIGEAQVTLTNLFAYSSESVTIPLSIPEVVIIVSDVNSANLSFSIDELPVRADDTFTLHLNVEDATDLAGWLCNIVFDPAVLEAVEVSEGDFLKKDDRTTFFLESTIDNTAGNITSVGSISLSRDGVSGTGKLLSVTFVAKTIGETQVTLTNLYAGSSDLVTILLSIPDFVITVEERVFLPWDVNQDGEVSILDLMQVAQYLGKDASVTPQADVDSDGMIGILDLIAVAQHIGETTASAPPLITNRGIDMNSVMIDSKELIPAMIRGWITQAQIENDGSIVFRKGIANLQRLLTSLMPEKTKLLANYPNPFNPETWLPYELSEPAEVTLTIYAANGKIVKTLVLGHQDAGIYKSRNRAVYWDGRNSMGEPVASGIYFYTLTAGHFSATRKMLITK